MSELRPSASPRVRTFVSAYPELIAVVIASVTGLVAQPPLRWLVDHQGINVLLVVLVFTIATTITTGNLRQVAASGRRVAVALVAGVTVLPALAWGVSRIVADGPLRNGVLSIGLAPCEIASVATVALAGGQAATAATILVGSTVLTVACAGPLLTLETDGASIRSAGVVTNLVLVVIVPLALGIAVRSRHNIGPSRERAIGSASTAAVAGLVALIASQVHLSRAYLAVGAAVMLFTAGAASLGWLLSIGASRTVMIPLVLTTSMRDFAIAAGIAASAFGSAAAAPLGLYGIVVLVWGTAAAGRLRAGDQTLEGSYG